VDNYAEFLERLKKAAASLKKRQARLNHVLRAVDSAAEQNRFGFNEWTKRNSRLEALLAGEDAGKPRALKDLHAISANMVNVFRGRSERVNARLTAVQTRVDQINRSLHSLELSKQKLTSSRRLAEERENLSKAMLGLAGTAEGIAVATPDGGLQDDLKSAREAVVLAEALLEVKGN
jgi:chromosome segregation ATPase